MDCVFAVQGDDYILFGCEKASLSGSIFKYHDNESKIIKLSKNKLLGVVGEAYDKRHFNKLIKCNLDLYKFKNGHELTTEESASYIRTELAEGIRSHPHQCNCLLAGFDADGPKLYWLDYMGSYAKLLKAAHGYGAYLIYGIMDNYYQKPMTLQQGELIIEKCINELKTRFTANFDSFEIFKITKDGIEDVSDKFNRRN